MSKDQTNPNRFEKEEAEQKQLCLQHMAEYYPGKFFSVIDRGGSCFILRAAGESGIIYKYYLMNQPGPQETAEEYKQVMSEYASNEIHMLKLLYQNGGWTPRAFPEKSTLDADHPVVVMEFIKGTSVDQAPVELRRQVREELLTLLSKLDLCLGDTELIYDPVQERIRVIDVGSFRPYPEDRRSSQNIRNYIEFNFLLLTDYLGLSRAQDSGEDQLGQFQQF